MSKRLHRGVLDLCWVAGAAPVAVNDPSATPTSFRWRAPGGSVLVTMHSRPDPRPFESGDASVWDLLDPESVPSGRFTTDPGVRLHAFDHRFIYGTVRDELDVTYVVRWRIEQPGMSGANPHQ